MLHSNKTKFPKHTSQLMEAYCIYLETNLFFGVVIFFLPLFLWGVIDFFPDIFSPLFYVILQPCFSIFLFSLNYHDDHEFETITKHCGNQKKWPRQTNHRNKWPWKTSNIPLKSSCCFLSECSTLWLQYVSQPQIWCECILNNGLLAVFMCRIS